MKCDHCHWSGHQGRWIEMGKSSEFVLACINPDVDRDDCPIGEIVCLGFQFKPGADVDLVVMPLKTICPECGEKMGYFGESQTLVGYFSPPGHNHDDNCQNRTYGCNNGHKITLSKRRKCSDSECDWTGKDECFCHPGKKVDEWPIEV